jgi:hypothetical protein
LYFKPSRGKLEKYCFGKLYDDSYRTSGGSQHGHSGTAEDKEVNDVKITVRAVKDKIRQLRVDGAEGPDKIGPLLLKKLVDEIAKEMSVSLRDGMVPDDRHTANVTPIFKKGSKICHCQLPACLPHVSVLQAYGEHHQGPGRQALGQEWAHPANTAWIYARTILHHQFARFPGQNNIST